MMAKKTKPAKGWLLWDFWKELVGGGHGSTGGAG